MKSSLSVAIGITAILVVLLIASCQNTSDLPTDTVQGGRSQLCKEISVYQYLSESATMLKQDQVDWFAQVMLDSVSVDIKIELWSEFSVGDTIIDEREYSFFAFGGQLIYYICYTEWDWRTPNPDFELCLSECMAGCTAGCPQPPDPLYEACRQICERECRIICAQSYPPYKFSVMPSW